MNYEDRVTKEYVENALAGVGNCKIATGSYVGNGEFGENHPNSLTFPFEPKLVAVIGYASSEASHVFFVRSYRMTRTGDYILSVSWTGNSVSWFCGNGVGPQYNQNGYTYYYVAIG